MKNEFNKVVETVKKARDVLQKHDQKLAADMDKVWQFLMKIKKFTDPYKPV